MVRKLYLTVSSTDGKISDFENFNIVAGILTIAEFHIYGIFNENPLHEDVLKRLNKNCSSFLTLDMKNNVNMKFCKSKLIDVLSSFMAFSHVFETFKPIS
jgi:hypothetical protein